MCKHSKIEKLHCLKSFRFWSYSGPYFTAFGLNKNQNNLEYGHFLLYCVFVVLYCIIEVSGNYCFLFPYLHSTPQVQFVWSSSVLDRDYFFLLRLTRKTNFCRSYVQYQKGELLLYFSYRYDELICIYWNFMWIYAA